MKDQKMFWVSLLTRGRWVAKDAGSKESWQALAGDSGIGRCCPSAKPCGRLFFPVLAKLTWPVLTSPSSTIQAVKYVILYLLMEDRPQPNTVYIPSPHIRNYTKCHANPFPDAQVMRGGYHAVVDSPLCKNDIRYVSSP